MPLTSKAKAALFGKLKSILKKRVPPMVVVKDKADMYELIGNKAVPYGYKKEIIPGMYFATTAIKKDSVTFYFFPIYFKPASYVKSAPSLMKLLKGKTCFHFKKEEQVNEKELNALLKLGVQAWRKEGYLDP